MTFSFFPGKIDLVDAAAALLLACAGLFVAVFFLQASAGAAGSEEAVLEQLRVQARKRILKEREQLAPYLEVDGARPGGEDWGRVTQEAGRFASNSQFQLLLARGYRERGEMASSLGAYRRALEINRDYSDRRSEFYLGDDLRPMIREAHALYLDGGGARRREEVAVAAVRDLFYIERSLAGGCH